jgi:ribosomal protein S18 acetylase RimI-like enzyme
MAAAAAAAAHLSPPPDTALRVRPATADDVTCIAHLARAAMPDDPSWDYRHTHRIRYQEDHQQWVQVEFKSYFDQSDRYHIDVVTAQDNEGGSDVPIAFAIWTVDRSVPHTACDLGVPFDREQPSERRDVNPVHFRALRDQLPAGDESVFGHYGNNRYELFVLGTHPLFRGRGAATLLVRVGLDRARVRRLPTTVLSGAHGRSFYAGLGFQFAGDFIVRVPGDEERIRITAMEHRGGLAPAPAPVAMINGHLTNGFRRYGSPAGVDDIDADSMNIELDLGS